MKNKKTFLKPILKLMLTSVLAASMLLTSCNKPQENNDDIYQSSRSAPDENTDWNESHSSDNVLTENQTENITEPVPDELSGMGAQSVITLKSLPIQVVVQQFAFATIGNKKYVFAAQRIGADCYLSQCVVSEDGKTANREKHTVLRDYGHAESMDVSVNGENTYIYIASGANPLNDYAWATQITRLKYDNGELVESGTITGLECATPDGTPIAEGYTPYRINFALDNEADLLAVYLRADNRNTGKSIKHCISVYKLSYIEKMLDRDGSVSLADCAEAFVATTGEADISDILYNQTFQGMEISSDGTICISSGTETLAPSLSFFSTENGTIKRKIVKKINWRSSEHFGTDDYTKTTKYAELESVKYYNGKWYVSFNPTGSRIMNRTEIFEITELS